MDEFCELKLVSSIKSATNTSSSSRNNHVGKDHIDVVSGRVGELMYDWQNIIGNDNGGGDSDDKEENRKKINQKQWVNV